MKVISICTGALDIWWWPSRFRWD